MKKTPAEIKAYKDQRYARLGAVARMDDGSFVAGRVLRLFEKMLDRGLLPEHDIFRYSHHPFRTKGDLTSRVDILINGHQNHRWFAWAETNTGSVWSPRGPQTFKGQVRSMRRSRGGLHAGTDSENLWVLGGTYRAVRTWSRDAKIIQSIQYKRLRSKALQI